MCTPCHPAQAQAPTPAGGVWGDWGSRPRQVIALFSRPPSPAQLERSAEAVGPLDTSLSEVSRGTEPSRCQRGGPGVRCSLSGCLRVSLAAGPLCGVSGMLRARLGHLGGPPESLRGHRCSPLARPGARVRPPRLRTAVLLQNRPLNLSYVTSLRPPCPSARTAPFPWGQVADHRAQGLLEVHGLPPGSAWLCDSDKLLNFSVPYSSSVTRGIIVPTPRAARHG